MHVARVAVVVIVVIVVLLSFLICMLHYRRGGSPRKRYFFVVETPMTHEKSDPDPKIPPLLLNVLAKKNYEPTSVISDAYIVFLRNLDDFRAFRATSPLISKLNTHRTTWIYGLNQVNLLANKATLAIMLRRKTPASIPITWVLSNPSERTDLMLQFDHDGTPKRLLILKNNRQQQKGLFFVNHISDIETKQQQENCVVCQAVLMKPYLFNGFKVNFRRYLLITYTDYQLEYRLYDDGFVYYASAPFHKETHSLYERHITTGLQGREIYQNNPLTFKQFTAQLTAIEARRLVQNINTLLTDVCRAVHPFLFEEEENMNSTTKVVSSFVLMGCDIAPDTSLNVKLMEINKGPDLRPKDKADHSLKEQMLTELVNVLESADGLSLSSRFLKIDIQ